MKTIFSKIIVIMGLIFITNEVCAASQLFIKNITNYDLKMKFAEKERTATESTLAAYTQNPNQTNNIYRVGPINNMYDISHLSIIDYGGWTSSWSDWKPLDVNSLRRQSEQNLAKQTIPGFETDIYWTIYGWDNTRGWLARADGVQRKK